MDKTIKEAIKIGEKYTRRAYMDLLNSMGNKKDEALQVYLDSPVYKQLKADYDCMKEALKLAEE